MAEVKEKQYSILMTEILAQKIYNGEKTQTRRALKTLPDEEFCDLNARGDPVFTADDKKYRIVKNRYGNVGDFLAVKELYFAYGYWQKCGFTKTGKPKMKFVDLTGTDFNYKYANDGNFRLQKGLSANIGWYKRTSIFMPRRAARSIVKITGLRVERVQDISEADARHELGLFLHRQPQRSFRNLWNDINKNRGFGWDANPWVLVIEFKKLTGEK